MIKEPNFFIYYYFRSRLNIALDICIFASIKYYQKPGIIQLHKLLNTCSFIRNRRRQAISMHAYIFMCPVMQLWHSDAIIRHSQHTHI